MQYRTLGRTGLRVSVVGFGGIPVQRVSEAEADHLVVAAREHGINFFDTARAYTDSEAKLGPALARERQKVVVATKSMARTREAMAADIEKSLTTMGLDYIDLYQMHNIKDEATLEQVTGPGGALEALLEARRQGRIKHIGMTSHIRDLLHKAMKHPEIETVQFAFNPVETAGVESLLSRAQETNTGTIIMKPLAGGAFREASLPLRYILQYPVSTVIPGMDHLDQVEQNAALGATAAPLTVEEETELERQVRELGQNFCRRCEYCQPCPQNIEIATVFLLDGYWVRYNLKDWARKRYQGLAVPASECLECGECEERCPYRLPIRTMLAAAHQRLTQP